MAMKMMSVPICSATDIPDCEIVATAATIRRRFLGLAPERTAPRPSDFGQVNSSSACIHFGISGCSPSFGLFRHRLEAAKRSMTPSRILNEYAPCDGSPLVMPCLLYTSDAADD